jgi:ADP-heptose:LPS heptosyltransferase
MEPAIDRVIRFDFFHARSDRGRRSMAKKELLKLQEELAPYRFDLAIDLRRQPDTRHILQHTGARWLAGFDQRNQTTWLDIAVEWEGDVARTHKRTHVSDALVQFVDAVATACEPDRRVIKAPPRRPDAMRALAALPEIEALGPALFTRPLVCVHTGAGSENKRWPTASFAGLIDLMVSQDDVTVGVIGGPDEAGLLEDLLATVHEPSRVFPLVARVSLSNLPLLLLACDLYVGNDSGPKHIAASLGVPTIGIHSGSVDATEWGPLGPAAIGIRRDMTCSPCYLAKVSDCHRSLACLHGIRVGDVHRACRRLLSLSRRPAGRSADEPDGLDTALLAAGL